MLEAGTGPIFVPSPLVETLMDANEASEAEKEPVGYTALTLSMYLVLSLPTTASYLDTK